jgi:cyanophycinase
MQFGHSLACSKVAAWFIKTTLFSIMQHIESHAAILRPTVKPPMSRETQNAILAIGGAEDKVHGKEILHTFVERSGGCEAHIGIIPCASRDPVTIATRYQTILQRWGSLPWTVMDIRDRSQGEDPIWKTKLEPCTGVFMTGGDQVRLCGLLSDTPLVDLLRQRAQLGAITLAGTSAGAAVMGHHMIAGGGSGESPNRSLVDMAIG